MNNESPGQIELEIKNYRCFSDEFPARLTISQGITAYIGTNNCGKSTILRFFEELRPIFLHLINVDLLTRLFQKSYSPSSFSRSVTEPEEVFSCYNTRDLTFSITLKFLDDKSENTNRTHVRSLQVTIHRDDVEGANVRLSVASPELRIEEYPQSLKVVLSNNNEATIESRSGKIYDFGAIYKVLILFSDTFYIGPFRNVINVGGETDYYDIKVGRAFVQMWKSLKAGTDRKATKNALKLTEDLRRIFNFESLEINTSADELTLQVIVDNQIHRLGELGAGIAQFIVVLGNVLLKPRRLLLIDEPELNLHPSLQLDFLTTLSTYSEYGIMFATHSYGLARSSAEQIYCIEKQRGKSSILRTINEFPALPELLGELGFSSYKELGFDSVLLVEGPSEVKAIQQLLRALHKDRKVVLVPLGGSQLIEEGRDLELLELKRISSNVYALIDSEKTSSTSEIVTKRRKFVESCRKCGITCHVLHRRSLDNYWTASAIQETFNSKKYEALDHFDDVTKVEFGWNKNSSWKIAQNVKVDELTDTDLMQFLLSI